MSAFVSILGFDPLLSSLPPHLNPTTKMVPAEAKEIIASRVTWRGYLLVVLSVLLLSIDALLIQEVSHLSEMTVVFYRYAFMGFTITIYYLIMERQDMYRRFYEIGWVGLLAGAINAGGGIAFTVSILNTHTANVFIIMATTPFTASLFSYFIFGELVPLRTVIAILVSFTAIAVVIYIELSSDFDTAWYGNVMALVSSVLYALYMVIIRGMNRGLPQGSELVDYIPCLIVAGILEATVGAAAGADFNAITNMDLCYLILQGVVVLSIGSAILTYATQFISAPEVCMFSLLDTLLEPVWVWLAGFDTPPYYTLYAGAFVVAAVLVNSLLALYEEEGDGEVVKLPTGAEPTVEEAERESTPFLSSGAPSSSNKKGE